MRRLLKYVFFFCQLNHYNITMSLISCVVWEGRGNVDFWNRKFLPLDFSLKLCVHWAWCCVMYTSRHGSVQVRCFPVTAVDFTPLCVPLQRVTLFLESSWKIFQFLKAPESPWKWIWCLKVFEFSIRGPWKCLNSKMVNSLSYVKNAAVIGEL